MNINTYQCPIKEFAHLLACTENDEVIGSSLRVYSGNNIWSNIKNVLFTDWLRLKIHFHDRSKCSTCSQQKFPLPASNYPRK